MKRTRAWVLWGLAAVAGVGLVRLLGPTVHEGERLLLLGDSMAEGLAPHLRALAAEHGVEFHALARRGSRIDEWAADPSLEDLLTDFQPHVVLVALGTNDVYSLSALERSGGAIRPLLDRLVGWPHRDDYGLGAAVVWVMPPSLPDELGGFERDDALLDRIRDEARTFPSDELDIPRAPDGVHPTAAGYAAWAGALWQWLT